MATPTVFPEPLPLGSSRTSDSTGVEDYDHACRSTCRIDRIDRLAGDSGSVMMLFPAAILIVLLLGSIAVDAAIIHLRQRELLDAASAAANDAATLGIDSSTYQTSGEIHLDARLAEAAVRSSLDARDMTRHLSDAPVVRVNNSGEVEVTLHTEARRLLGVIVPGASRKTEVAATGRSRLARSG